MESASLSRIDLPSAISESLCASSRSRSASALRSASAWVRGVREGAWGCARALARARAARSCVGVGAWVRRCARG